MNPEPYQPGRTPGEKAGPDSGSTLPGRAGPASSTTAATGAGWLDRWRRGRAAFRGWRRSRPFWGGLLLILAGVELLLIPVASLLIHNAIKIVIYIGIGGVFGLVFGGLLVTCGLLAWFHPVQRLFYAIVGVLLALGSFIVTNLGGFFLGMLLGVIGASLVFAWTPLVPEGGHRRRSPEPESSGGGLAALLGSIRRRGRNEPGQPGATGGGLDALLGSRGGRGGGGASRLLALPLVPLLLLGTAQAPALAAPAQGSCLLPFLSFLCGSADPAAAATATPTPTATANPAATSTPTPTPKPTPTATGSPKVSSTPSPGTSKKPTPVKKATVASSLMATTSTVSITAGSATMDGAHYEGVATVPTTGGGSQQMLKLTMTSLSLTGTKLTVVENGRTTTTTNTSLRFSGNVVLYATKLCGSLLGIPLPCFTPQNQPTIINLTGGLIPLTLTNVTTDQPLTTSNSFAAPGLQIAAG
jgi:Family of unknown function (DUF6114)